VIRIVQSERVFQAVERSKHEHERFYKASSALNRALTLAEVYDAAIEGARGVCEFDLALIATFDARDGTHVITRAVGESAEELTGVSHRDPSSLASMVVKNKLALPAAGEWGRDEEMYVFDPGSRMKKFESLYMLPLLVKDEVVGTFAVAARRPGAFPGDRREMLGVIANQVAISLQNGRMYEMLEEQATTDGLTGLVNHRTFQERCSAMLGRADRHKFKVSLILTDIDHFKKINDSYGHPVGDQVLGRVASILKASARKIDIVARYGGEEFAIVLYEADRSHVQETSRRIQTEIEALGIVHAASPAASKRLTVSVGAACIVPKSGRTQYGFIQLADEALYDAKECGRNCVVIRDKEYEQLLTGAFRGGPQLPPPLDVVRRA
jgi:diguanylate cyclase (GGDEF)-like protein